MIMDVKTYADHRTHFISRLRDRYNIAMGDDEYDMLCNLQGVRNNFQGVYKKNSNLTVGYISIMGIKIWALYESELRCFKTCYPPEVETDINEMIDACFPRALRYLALFVYEYYLSEKNSINFKFDTIKDAAIYFINNTQFPSLHIELFKHGNVSTIKIVHQISKILKMRSKHVKLCLVPNKH